jgi:hypothetical protein
MLLLVSLKNGVLLGEMVDEPIGEILYKHSLKI